MIRNYEKRFKARHLDAVISDLSISKETWIVMTSKCSIFSFLEKQFYYIVMNSRITFIFESNFVKIYKLIFCYCIFWMKWKAVYQKPINLDKSLGACFIKLFTDLTNRRACIRHQCRKTAVLSCHRCLINTGVQKITTFKYRLELWPPGACFLKLITAVIYGFRNKLEFL